MWCMRKVIHYFRKNATLRYTCLRFFANQQFFQVNILQAATNKPEFETKRHKLLKATIKYLRGKKHKWKRNLVRFQCFKCFYFTPKLFSYNRISSFWHEYYNRNNTGGSYTSRWPRQNSTFEGILWICYMKYGWGGQITRHMCFLFYNLAPHIHKGPHFDVH